MSFGSGPYGTSPYGGGSSLFQVSSAVAINPFTVVVTFSDPPDFANPETVNPSNYYFGGVLTAIRVVPDPDLNSLRVITTEQLYQLYTVVVSDLVTAEGTSATVDPLANSAVFTGFTVPRFSARAQSATAINLLFFQPMLADLNLSDPTNYALKTLDGVPVSVLSATPNTLTGPTSVVLKVSPLISSVPYAVQISLSVKALDGRTVIPDSAVLTWSARPDRKTSVSLSGFTGEVRASKDTIRSVQETLTLRENLSVILDPLTYGPSGTPSFQEVLTLVEGLLVTGSGVDTTSRHAISLSDSLQTFTRATFNAHQDPRSTVEGSFTEALTLEESLEVLPEVHTGLDPAIANLFGNPQGLVFFSPSLKTGGSPLSSLQVDSVEACTQAFDSYLFPKTIDPSPLYTHGGGVVPTPNVSTLNTNVFFVEFYRLGEAQHKIQDKPRDRQPPPVDIGATITLKQVYPPTRVAILNSTGWKLFDNSAPPPYPFITADNLSPLPVPVPAPVQHYVNPVEELTLGEGLQTLTATSISVSDTLSQVEDFDLIPGENVVLVNVADSLALAEALVTQVGIRLFETLTITEGISTV